jgi:hypothetical protein
MGRAALLHCGVVVLARAVNSAHKHLCLLLQDLLTSAGILKSSKHHLTILKGVTGVLKPGRLTLLLGPPGSG